MDTRERVARDIRNKWGWGPERIADSVCNIFDEERAELVKALKPFATWRCENPIREDVPTTKYASHTLLHDCGKCDTCKARAAIAKATGK